MNRFTVAPVTLVLFILSGCSSAAPAGSQIPGDGDMGGEPSTAPSPTPSFLARGNFTSHGVVAQLDASGAGDNVTGTMTVNDAGNRATVALECSHTSDGGLIEVGGLVTESTFDDAFPEGRRVAVIFQPGSPVKAVWHVAWVSEPLVASCKELVENVIDPAEVSSDLEPIQGNVEFGP